MSIIMKIGPDKKNWKNVWDEKGHTEIVQLFVSHDKRRITSIQFQYYENQTLVFSNRHGSTDNSKKFNAVKLNYPLERITSISGYYDSNGVLTSLKFGTNQGEYGPFGAEYNRFFSEFSSHIGEACQFSGFYGTLDLGYVRTIGIYLNPISALDPVVERLIKTQMLGRVKEESNESI